MKRISTKAAKRVMKLNHGHYKRIVISDLKEGI